MNLSRCLLGVLLEETFIRLLKKGLGGNTPWNPQPAGFLGQPWGGQVGVAATPPCLRQPLLNTGFGDPASAPVWSYDDPLFNSVYTSSPF
jgi:hypothetical protein